MAQNLSTVEHIYACFGQGDVPGILSKLSSDVSFFNAADPSVAPFGGTFKGKEGVAQFFTALGTTTQTTLFQTSNFVENGREVSNDVVHSGQVLANGQPFEVTAHFVWTFNEQGEVIDWTSSGDFSSLNAAMATS
ncbi:MAG: nuclear transport factor 2 family protein [Saprospiraceae bacterium]|nr:nuclear transport factor 2 family protein [Saprospiraceae bacterium]